MKLRSQPYVHFLTSPETMTGFYSLKHQCSEGLASTWKLIYQLLNVLTVIVKFHCYTNL